MYVKDLMEAFDGELIVAKVNGIPVVWEPFKGEGADVYKVTHIDLMTGKLRIAISGGTGSRTQGYIRDAKPISKMNTNELREWAIQLGARGVYGTSKETLKLICRRLESEAK